MDKQQITLDLKSNSDIYIDEVKFQQKNNESEGIFDEALTKESDESNTATLTVTVANISEDTDMTKIPVTISSFKGFKQSGVKFKGYNKNTKIAKYEIEVTYEGLFLTDLEEEKYIDCEIQAIVNKEKLTKTTRIEAKNIEEEQEEYKYYYGQIDESDSKIHYTEFEVKDEITIEEDDEAIVFIKIIGEDISEKHLVIENTTYDKAGKYVNGGTRYGIAFRKSGTYKAILDGKEIATITVTINSNSEIKYVYVFDVNKNGINTVTNSEANKAKTDRQNPENEIGTNGTEVNWIISDLEEKDSNEEPIKYYCYDANKGLKFLTKEDGETKNMVPHYYKYKSKEKIELNDKDLLILAFLQKVSEEEAKKINNGSLPSNWKENAIQYYIWNEITNTGNNIGYGSLTTLITTLKNNTNGENDYISFENKTITLDGKTYKIKDYTAVEYIVKCIYKASDGSILLEYKESEEDKYRQPLFTFDVELEEGPGIQLSKVDEEENPLEATFTVLEGKKEGKFITYHKLGEYKTDKETGLTEVIPTKADTKYAIFETKAPEGYKPTKQYVIVTVDKEGNCEYKTLQAPEECIDKKGYVKLTELIEDGIFVDYTLEAIFIEDGKEVTEDPDWNSGEVKENGEVELQLVLTNKYEMPPIKIIKVDQDGVRIGGKGGKFEITINGKTLDPKFLDENGEINLSLIEEKITGTKLEITVKEITPPDGYEPLEIDEITFTVEYTEENGWEITEILELEEDGFKVDIVNSVIQIQIENIKKKDIELQILKVDDSNSPLSGVGFKVSCNGLPGLSDSSTTRSDGTTNILKAKKENIKPGTYTVTITESPLEGYKPIGEVTFTITVNEDGSIVVGKSSNSLVSISTSSTDDVFTIIVTIENKKEEEDNPVQDGLQLPLIMTISGRAWLDQPQGKNSQANGVYDSGEELAGITVRVYEEDGVTPAKFADKALASSKINEGLAKKYLGKYYNDIKTKIDLTSESNETPTNENGEFVFSGLDPAKLYTVEFEYNGMRYSEIKASINIEGCGTPKSVATTTTATAIEDSGRRAEITQMFSEIGPYPNNYSGGRVFTQTEVEEYIKSDKTIVPTGATSADMERFIKDTKITARIENLGGILKQCEKEVAGYNGGLDSKTGGSYVFPVVVEKVDGPSYEYTDQKTKQEALKKLNNEFIAEFNRQYYGGNTDWVGYRVIANETWKRTVTHYKDHPHGKPDVDEPTYEPMFWNYFKYKIKDYDGSEYDQPFGVPPGVCGKAFYDEEGNYEGSCTGYVGDSVSYELDGQSNFQVVNYYVEDGYSTGVVEDETYHTRLSTWDTENEPLYDYDKINGKPGELNKGWGWKDKLTGIDDNNLDKGAKEGLGNLFAFLDSKINMYSPASPNVDLCVVYMPTVDLGLYNDVQKAIVTINGQEEKYIYDKRAANGKIFQFGVNEYDIQNSKNVKGNAEEAYAEYYQSLTDGNPNGGESTVGNEPYEDIGIRKEDVNINLEGTDSDTETGQATAGYYNDYEVSIEMVYRIKLYNQAEVSAHVTSIWDYYMDTFEFDGVYKDKDCTQPINVSATDATAIQVEGYKVKEIKLNKIQLNGNDSYEIFIKLHMKDPKATLGGDVLDTGYTTWNYAEISGYGTKIGVIDIDSCPGDLRPEERFESGPYDDDEGKSPTLTYRNPIGASRTISGVMFEDVTGKTEIKSYIGEKREGDGIYSEQDKPIAGATVQLVEVDASGKPLSSPKNIETGVRAQTLTKEDGTYEFDKVVASNYIVRFKYGNNYQTVLTKLQGYKNDTSYNGESYENTIKDKSLSGEYWYTNAKEGSSYIEDNLERRTTVINNFAELINEKAEILNSWKDISPNKKLVDQLIERANMYSETERMLLDVEYHPRYENKIVETEGNGTYEKTYIMGNINGGIVERERAELQIIKTVKEISIVDSSGKQITGGKAGEDIKYVKWIQGPGGFVDMEIDSELLSGATLKITYEIAVTNTSEAGNDISNIQVIDYVSNNLNFDTAQNKEWTPETVQNLMAKEWLNSTSLKTNDASNRIDLLTYQTILSANFGTLTPKKTKTKTLTLEKNLSSEEDSNFNYENQVEIVSSYNPTGRGDYSSIYGNLDPTTYTSRQGNLNWDKIDSENQNGFRQMPTDETVISELGQKVITNPNAIRLAEKDSGNAEEVIITPPTGAKGIVFETQHYILAIIGLLSLAGAIILIKKYNKIGKE